MADLYVAPSGGQQASSLSRISWRKSVADLLADHNNNTTTHNNCDRLGGVYSPASSSAASGSGALAWGPPHSGVAGPWIQADGVPGSGALRSAAAYASRLASRCASSSAASARAALRAASSSRRACVTGLTVDVSSAGSWSRAASGSPVTASTPRSPGPAAGASSSGPQL